MSTCYMQCISSIELLLDVLKSWASLEMCAGVCEVNPNVNSELRYATLASKKSASTRSWTFWWNIHVFESCIMNRSKTVMNIQEQEALYKTTHQGQYIQFIERFVQFLQWEMPVLVGLMQNKRQVIDKAKPHKTMNRSIVVIHCEYLVCVSGSHQYIVNIRMFGTVNKLLRGEVAFVPILDSIARWSSSGHRHVGRVPIGDIGWRISWGRFSGISSNRTKAQTYEGHRPEPYHIRPTDRLLWWLIREGLCGILDHEQCKAELR